MGSSNSESTSSAATAARVLAGRTAIGERRFAQAAAIANEILSLAPQSVDALEIRALVEAECGEHAAAEQTLRSVIAIAPERRWPYGDLARLLLNNGRADDAEQVASQALQADPENPDAHAMLASLLSMRERWVETAAHFKRAIALTGPHPQLLAGLGLALLRRGRLQDARRALSAATSGDAQQLEPLVHLAEAEERLGLFDQALAHLGQAEVLARHQGTDVDLQRCVLLARMGGVEEALELIDGREDLSGAALLQRGRLRERCGRFSEAWRDWIRGKAALAMRGTRQYPASEVEAKARRLSAYFASPGTAELSRAIRRNDVAQPIFIVGFPRSGTTMLEQILTSHSRIAAGGELPFGADLFEFATAGTSRESLFPDDRIDQRTAEQFRDFYLQRAKAYGLLDAGAEFFTDKMPDNAFWLPLLRIAFPDSPVLLMRRHPLDVLTSVMAHDMTHGFNCAYRIEDAARHLALTDELLDTYGSTGVGATCELRYEMLVADQERETRRLMQAIRLDIEPAQLKFHERAEVSPTPSYAQVREPLNDRSIGRWRNFAAELEPICPIVSKPMTRGGYAF